MKNSCFRASACSSVKRNIDRIQRQKFGYSALLQILRGGTSMKSKGDLLETDKKIREKVARCRKNLKGELFSLIRFRKCVKKFLAEAGTRTRDR